MHRGSVRLPVSVFLPYFFGSQARIVIFATVPVFVLFFFEVDHAYTLNFVTVVVLSSPSHFTVAYFLYLLLHCFLAHRPGSLLSPVISFFHFVLCS